MRNSSWMVAASATLLWVGMAQAAATPQQKCQQSKLKAQGKLMSCLAKNAAGVIVGKADESAECRTKFTTALAKADTKASDKGTSCRFIDNLDGTVSDLNTGLVWEKKTASGVHNVSNAYSWATIDGTTPNGTAFTDFLGTLNGGTSNDGTAVVTPCFTGHCDWRLPTIQELQGIADPTAPTCGSGPCIDPTFGSTQASDYWSSTTDTDVADYGWTLNFGYAGVAYLNKPTLIAARAVRGGL